MLDSRRLRDEINELAHELHELKKIFREPHQPRLTREAYWRLREWKRRATILCAIRAHSRGKLHLKPKKHEPPQTMTLEEQWKLIESHVGSFQIQAA